MFESLIFAIILLFFNFIFMVKPVPIIGIFIACFTFFMCGTYFLTDTTLPVNSPNPLFTIFIACFAGISFLIQAWDIRKK